MGRLRSIESSSTALELFRSSQKSRYSLINYTSLPIHINQSIYLHSCLPRSSRARAAAPVSHLPSLSALPVEVLQFKYSTLSVTDLTIHFYRLLLLDMDFTSKAVHYTASPSSITFLVRSTANLSQI